MKEIEIKFRLDNPDAIRDKIKKIGAKFIKKVFEENFRFDNAKNEIQSKNHLLRLRKDDVVRLTFKDKRKYSQNINGRNLQVAEEIEVEISDFRKMKIILERLGFKIFSRYQKEREIWHYQNCEVLIDKLPYLGYFLEIEAPAQDIEKLTELLGLNIQNGIINSYGEIWKQYRKKHKIKARDMLFK